MPCISVGPGLVSFRLSGLGEQDQRSRVGRLKAESEIEQDEGIRIEVSKKEHAVCDDPRDHHHGLTDEILRGAEETCQSFRNGAKPTCSKGSAEVRMRIVVPQVILALGYPGHRSPPVQYRRASAVYSEAGRRLTAHDDARVVPFGTPRRSAAPPWRVGS